ncbi:Peptidase C1A, papain C-terminal [Sesbania bispinosa]|nr:Peptidase C1A, papain C-terminal [Sesbania bispinosa]
MALSHLSLSFGLLLSLSFLALASAIDMSIIDYDANLEARTDTHLRNIYEAWLVKHRKFYNALGEKERRFEIFKDTYASSMSTTKQRTKPSTTIYQLQWIGERKVRLPLLKIKANVLNGIVVPEGSCWAFSTVAAVEGIIKLSPKNAKVVTIDGYEDVPENDEKSLMKAVANQPVSVALKLVAEHFNFMNREEFLGSAWGENGYIKLERNVLNTETGKCGIAMEPSYPIKKGQNPPNPGPTPPSPASPSTVCDEYYSCSSGTTCCCIFEFKGFCFGWGCCPVESATCCEDSSSCCPPDYPVCDVKAETCRLSKDNPFGIKALRRRPAKSTWTQRKAAMKSNNV